MLTGRNELNGQAWTVTCHIIECVPPTLVRWTVEDPAHPSSTWTTTLSPTSAGCAVIQRFDHGPGNSGVRNMIRRDPGSAAFVISVRSQMLEDNMRAGLRSATRLAEQDE